MRPVTVRASGSQIFTRMIRLYSGWAAGRAPEQALVDQAVEAVGRRGVAVEDARGDLVLDDAARERRGQGARVAEGLVARDVAQCDGPDRRDDEEQGQAAEGE